MNTTLRLLFLLIITVASLLTVDTAPASQGEGTFSILGIVPNPDATLAFDGENTIIHLRIIIVNDGTIVGTSIAEVICVTRLMQEGTCQGFETFKGSVDGVEGTLIFNLRFRFDGISLEGEFIGFRGEFSVVSGTEGLAGLDGRGTFEGVVGTVGGTYSLQYHFSPQ